MCGLEVFNYLVFRVGLFWPLECFKESKDKLATLQSAEDLTKATLSVFLYLLSLCHSVITAFVPLSLVPCF